VSLLREMQKIIEPHGFREVKVCATDFHLLLPYLSRRGLPGASGRGAGRGSDHAIMLV
jgi:hypothetical protein